MGKAKLARSRARQEGQCPRQCTREEEPSFRNHRRVKIWMDRDVDDRREAAFDRALERGREPRRLLDPLAVRAEAAGERAKAHVVVAPRKEAPAVELLLEGALVAE